MNQFKDVFTGKRKVEYNTATSCQKCIRAGGKHNDLDNVGFTARHHTFFEMLGNFSFGDYFKEEAIHYAWEWITKEVGLPKERMYASVYDTDDEAFALWAKIAPELKNGRILRFGKKDNYWSMGDVGPCGPCSEIHFDRGEKFGTGPEDKVNGETERFVEIWNLVFMQFDQLPDGSVVDLPKPSVDTGAGLERMASIIQDVDSNYEIDIFKDLIAVISEMTKAKYSDHPVSHHVIADHLRALSFAIADGAGISNEGQGYVLRRILRRAARHGRLLGAHEPFMYKLVPTLTKLMGDAYPELGEKQSHIVNVLRAEEESFARTLDTGLDLFEKVAAEAAKSKSAVIDGDDVFKLYDTFGFPVDLTEILASEKNMTIDMAGFEKAMQHQKKQSKAASGFGSTSESEIDQLVKNLVQNGLEKQPATEFIRESLTADAKMLQWSFGSCDEMALVLDRTPFYAESGGQIGDVGKIVSRDFEIDVTAMRVHQDRYVHVGRLTKGSLPKPKESAPVSAVVDNDRRWDTMRNHTATHLTHAALREVLGSHIKQSGSYVGPDRMRFDFSHHQPMTPEEIVRVEKIVNDQILRGTDVTTDIMNVDEAKKAGAMALFGEKYGETVRVVQVPGFSMELCGGTHVSSVSQIGPFFITLETGIASGVRRLEAITGREAIAYMLDAKQYRQEVATVVGKPEKDSLEAVRQLREQVSSLQKDLKKAKADLFSGGGQQVGSEQNIGKLTLIAHDFGDTDRGVMSAWIDQQKGNDKPLVAVALGMADGKRMYMAAASSKANKDHGCDIGKLTKELLPQYGGRGGGKPTFAQGSVDDNTESQKLFDTVRDMLTAESEKKHA